MKLFINGEERQLEVTTVSTLVEQLAMKADRVAVELNRQIVPRADWPQTALRDGDKLEIVHFVGGGCEEFHHGLSQAAAVSNLSLIQPPTQAPVISLEFPASNST
jgi:thiamine biosynthesis protein ThiS